MDLQIGKEATRSKVITIDDIKKYAEITGDYNPLHFDLDFAKNTKFGDIVVQGGITSGLLNALVAMEMPGPGSVFLNQNLQYSAPVYVGDIITAIGKITKLHETKPVTTLNVEIRNQKDEVVLSGVCVCYTFSGKV